MLAFLLLLAPTQERDDVARIQTPHERIPKPTSIELSTNGIAALLTLEAADGYLAFIADEEEHGGLDLNRDGDAEDLILHLFDVAKGAAINLELAGFTRFLLDQENDSLVGGQLAFYAAESEGGVDLNGDGDLFDSAAYVFDANTGALHTAGLLADPYVVGGPHAALAVAENQMLQDLNLDGDMLDVVYHDWNLSTGEIRNLGVTVSGGIVPSLDTFLFLSSEGDEGDLNGDGDALDRVLLIYDPLDDLVLDSGLAVGQYGMAGRDGLEGIAVDESAQGNTDLNGDGDTNDDVLFVYDTKTDELRNLSAAVRRPAQGGFFVSEPFRAGADVVAYVVSETHQGATDLNGDGDAADLVLFVHRFSSATTVNLESAVFGYRVGEELVSFDADESDQGEDLNGDGDLNDFVLHVYDPRSGETTNTGLAINQGSPQSYAHEIGRDRVAFTVSETAQGADLNDDGDQSDDVHHLFVASTGELINLGLGGFVPAGQGAVPNSALGRQAFYFSVSESMSGDLNLDGDAEDTVLFARDHRTGDVVNTMGVGQIHGGVAPRRLALTTSESKAGVDLNGDGDTGDYVVRAARVRP